MVVDMQEIKLIDYKILLESNEATLNTMHEIISKLNK